MSGLGERFLWSLVSAAGFGSAHQAHGLARRGGLLRLALAVGGDEQSGNRARPAAVVVESDVQPVADRHFAPVARSIGSAWISIFVSIDVRPTYVTSAEISTSSPT